ncbi:MAG: hypothetical protein K2I36_01620 [Ureaplasma sp.]|nr:hypothetical protein [Ureaplasma sp.]MDE7222107.1 hypothetical protein [Ureaplasma sp.]
MQRTNSIVIFPITLIIYISIILYTIFLFETFGTNDIKILMLAALAFFSTIGMFLFVFDIVALTLILNSKIDKKWKKILSISWVVFTPIYFVIYYLKFNIIFEKILDKTTNIENNKKINLNSIISFFVIILFLISFIFQLATIFKYPDRSNQPNWVNIGDEISSVIFFISLSTYIFNYFISIYISMFISNKSICYLSRIPLAFSVIWMHNKNKSCSYSKNL